MEELDNKIENIEGESKNVDIVYNSEKDFYKGIGGELRYKAEGLFKKAREKGISIFDVEITILKDNHEEFPGIGDLNLPTYLVKVKGQHLQSGQIVVDAKQLDFLNRYKKYIAEVIEKRNIIRDVRGKVVRAGNMPAAKSEPDFGLTDWEKFQIGKNLIEDKEFGLEKTITGGCDRIIRKLMGENDWLYPGEAKLLDEEFNTVQKKISVGNENRKIEEQGLRKKATDRQINYFKARIKNSGLDPEDETVMNQILNEAGYSGVNLEELNTSEMSKIIDSMGVIILKLKDSLTREEQGKIQGNKEYIEGHGGIKQ